MDFFTLAKNRYSVRKFSERSMNWKKGSFPGRLMQESLEPI